jgi:hypothetical protein
MGLYFSKPIPVTGGTAGNSGQHIPREPTLYEWRREFIAGGKERLARRRREQESQTQEIAELKALVAELTVANRLLRNSRNAEIECAGDGDHPAGVGRDPSPGAPSGGAAGGGNQPGDLLSASAAQAAANEAPAGAYVRGTGPV